MDSVQPGACGAHGQFITEASKGDDSSCAQANLKYMKKNQTTADTFDGWMWFDRATSVFNVTARSATGDAEYYNQTGFKTVSGCFKPLRDHKHLPGHKDTQARVEYFKQAYAGLAVKQSKVDNTPCPDAVDNNSSKECQQVDFCSPADHLTFSNMSLITKNYDDIKGDSKCIFAECQFDSDCLDDADMNKVAKCVKSKIGSQCYKTKKGSGAVCEKGCLPYEKCVAVIENDENKMIKNEGQCVINNVLTSNDSSDVFVNKIFVAPKPKKGLEIKKNDKSKKIA
jgi:hypothetical protein